MGASWGLGHTIALFLAGVLVLIFKLSIPVRLSSLFEFGIGILLVGLGADLLRRVGKGELHNHAHQHDDGIAHSHLHSHSRTLLHHHSHRSLIVGMLHGVAGSGVLALLVLASATTIVEGMAFILIFGIGSILGMMLTSTLIALPFRFIDRSQRLMTGVHIFAGIVSIFLGFFMMVGIVSSGPLVFPS